MVTLTADFYIISSLIFVEIIILLLYIFMYLKKQQRIFRPLIYSMLLFLAANSLIIIEIFYDIPSLEFFNALLAAAGLAPIVIFLEIFENGVPFTPRSAGSIIFILFIGATKGAKSLLGEQIGPFFSFIAPILFIIIGVFFNQTINKMKERVRFENQKKKLRKVKTGIYLTFIFPKFISGTFFTLNLFSVILFEGYDIEFLFSSLMSNVFESIVSSMQFIGLIIMSLPIIFSQSVFFMQSRKVSQLIVINPDGVPIFDFNFESAKNQCDANLLNESFRAISSVMETGEITCQELRSMNFGELQILTEIRNHFAVLLVVDRPTLFLNRSLEMFADDFMKIYPKHQPLEDVPIQEIKVTAEKMIQKDFGLEQEEFEQIREIVQEGYDRVADEYLAARADDTDEIRLLDDLLKRLPEDSKILDAGCGAGIPITNKLSTKHNVIGVDISRKQIEIARDLCPEAEFIWQDITTLTYPDEYFDAIVSYYTISHIPREEHKGVLENFYRMLKKEGYALLAFATTDDPGTVVDDFFGVKMYWSSFDASTNIAMLKEIGFKIAWVKLIFDSITDKQNLVVLAQKTEKELEEYAEINFEKEKKEESEE